MISGSISRGTLIPAVSMEMISLRRDIELSEKSKASSKPTGSEMRMICGSCVR